MNTFLQQAFNLAQVVDPHETSPNPRVGCVVVRDGEIIATGVHHKRGGDHAEVDALKKLEGQDLSGCEVYITLEPCDCFEGKQTGSCTQLLISKKPKKVIIGALDVRFCGKNVEKMKAAGIAVETLRTTSHDDFNGHKQLNPFYDHFFYTKKPYVCLKMAQSLDGKVRRGTARCAQWVSNSASRKRVHQMRAQYQAILTTTKTIVEDNARLDVRLQEGDVAWLPTNPIVLVLGKKEDIPASSVFWDIKERELHFFDTHDLLSVSDAAAEMGILSIMTELGPTVATQLLKENLVDEMVQFIAPKVFGEGLDMVKSEVDMKDFAFQEVQDIEGDLLLRWKKKVE